MILDISPDDWGVIARAGLLGLLSLAFYMIRSVMKRFKSMERETYKIEENHKFVQRQFDSLMYNIDNLQSDVNRLLDVLLHSENTARPTRKLSKLKHEESIIRHKQ